MSSEDQIRIVAPGRNKLILDSEQQERKQQQEKQRLEQIQRRKQEKRRKRQEAEKLEMQKLKQQEEKQKKYDQPEMMFEQDSDDGVEFKRVVKKIKRTYPDQVNKYEVQAKKKNDFIVPDNEDDQQDQSDSDSYDQDEEQSQQIQKKAKKQQKAEKKEKKIQKKPVEKKKVQAPVKKQKVKTEEKNDLKEYLVKLVSVRWWYALPEWPPADFDYNGKLKELGYRVLDSEKFKLQEDIVNGLQKCMPVQGYIGVYKSKTKLIDVRPKQSAPTLNNFRNKSIQELNSILKRALAAQMDQLKKVQHQQKGEADLLVNLEKTLNKRK